LHIIAAWITLKATLISLKAEKIKIKMMIEENCIYIYSNQGPPGGMNMMGGNQGPPGGMNMMGGMGFGGQMPGFSGGGSGGMMQGQMMGDAILPR
jgi:hypothetical protein